MDGRVKDDRILQAVCGRLEGGPEKIVPFVYAPKTDKSAIAKFSGIALEQAELGNPEAQEILRHGAQELALLVSAVQERLELTGCPIALLGGLLEHDNSYRRTVAEALSHYGTVIAPGHNALWGAAQMAWEL